MTAAQKKLLRDLHTGGVLVERGKSWFQRHPNGMLSRVSALTARALVRSALVVPEGDHYAITAAGRAALD